MDGGDFSVGSLIQALYTTQAAELRTMGAMGYDAVTVGNHEFDGTGSGFGEMLTAARRSGDVTPALLLANYRPEEDSLDLQRAMAAYGVEESLLLERGGVTYGIFGLMGRDAHACAPTSGFVLEDPVRAARRCVERLEEQGAEVIVCLSHGGTSPDGTSEDEELARAVEGIDLIVSGHTHTALEEPILAGETYIVSAGEYGKNLGSVTLSWNEAGEKTLTDYRLIPLDGTWESDPEIAALADYVYEHVFVHYTMKQWGQTPEEIDPNTTARVPVFLSRDDRYFQDAYQGMPLEAIPSCSSGCWTTPASQWSWGRTP